MKKPLFEILFENQTLIAVNKPSGMLCLPDRYDTNREHLAQVLSAQFGELYIVHRIDADTSGVILLARTAEAHHALNEQFSHHTVVKKYHALLTGAPAWESTGVDLALLPDADNRHRTVVNTLKGKTSSTQLQVLERYTTHTLVEAQPQTGRTHQIRVHCAAIGFPVAVDTLYGTDTPVRLSDIKGKAYKGDISTEKPLLSRLGLHAHSISFVDPDSLTPCTIEAPYPDDVRICLKKLGQYGTRSHRIRIRT